jgi:PTH1 family peptidyl-tRNA hydrolase
VGLGNPGPEFERTRHNVGADAVSILSVRYGERLRNEKGTRSEVSRLRRAGRLVVLARPKTFMNESGVAVAALIRRFPIVAVRNLVVVHDELDLPPGSVRVKLGGGTAGHNGLKSINAHLGDPGYGRVRIGIGKPAGRQPGAEYVLRRPGRAEREALDGAVEVAADAMEAIITEGLDEAMNRFNGL